MFRVLAVLLVCACGPSVSVYSPPTSDVACETDNGILVMSPAPVGYCDEIQGVEDRVFQAFRDVAKVDERFNSSMARTRGWKIVVNDVLFWSDGVDDFILGQTDCPNRTIYLNNNRPASSVIGHELAHAVQFCVPAEPWDLSGGIQTYYHSNWAPIYTALKKQNLRP